MSEPVVTPRDCTLLLAIPLSKAEFVEDYHDEQKDFAKQFTVSRGDPEVIWTLMFERPVRVVLGVVQAVERLGVRIVRKATLHDWSKAFEAFKVITLVAHWRFVPLRASDIVDPDAVVEYAARRDTALACHLDDALIGVAREPSAIAAVLEALCKPARIRYERADRNATGRGISRVVLEYEVPGIRSAKAIEFADGLYSALSVADATPADHGGVIDLSVCNSILLGEVLKRRKRPGLVVCGEFPASMEFRSIRYRVVQERLHKRPGRYCDELQALGSTL